MNERKSPSKGVLDFGVLTTKAQSVKSHTNWMKQYFLVGECSGAAILKSKQVPLSQIKYIEKYRTQPCSPRYQSQTSS